MFDLHGCNEKDVIREDSVAKGMTRYISFVSTLCVLQSSFTVASCSGGTHRATQITLSSAHCVKGRVHAHIIANISRLRNSMTLAYTYFHKFSRAYVNFSTIFFSCSPKMLKAYGVGSFNQQHILEDTSRAHARVTDRNTTNTTSSLLPIHVHRSTTGFYVKQTKFVLAFHHRLCSPCVVQSMVVRVTW